jgi:hypothetical protein
MDAIIADTRVNMAQVMKASAAAVSKQLHHICFTARKRLDVHHLRYDVVNCSICGRYEVAIAQYGFENENDSSDDSGSTYTILLEACTVCNDFITPCIEQVISGQRDNYVYQYMFLRKALGRDLAGVIARHYHVVEMSVFMWN